MVSKKKEVIPVKKGRVKETHLVTQSNKLIEAMYRMGLTAKKLMVCMISQVEPGDEDFKYYMIPVADFKRLANITGRTNYFKVLVNAARELRAKDIIIIEGDEKINVGLVSAVKENQKSKMIGIRFDKELKPYLLNIKSEFTRYPLRYVMGMKSVYSIRLYELLKQYEKTNQKERVIAIHELREMVGVEPTKYKRYNDFKRKVLEVAQKELPKQSDIGFIFEEIKEGRAVKFIKFIISPRKKTFIDDGTGEIDTADLHSISEIPDEVTKWIPSEYKSNHDVLRDVKNYIKTHGIGYVVQKVAFTASKSPNNFAAYLGNCLKKDYGADFDPHQMELFEKAALVELKPGTKLTYEGKLYTVDDAECIWPDTGGCMPPGKIRQLIKEGEIQINEQI